MRVAFAVLVVASAARADETDERIAADRKACKGGDVEACFDLADQLPWQNGGPAKEARDIANRTIDALKLGCEAKKRDACVRLTSIDPWRDHAWQMYFARAACDLGDGQSCSSVADEYDMNDDDASRAQATKFRVAACTGGNAWSCVVLARAETAHDKAMRLLERACNIDSTTCLWLADELPPDDPRVRELIDRAAAAGMRRGWMWSTPTGGGFVPE